MPNKKIQGAIAAVTTATMRANMCVCHPVKAYYYCIEKVSQNGILLPADGPKPLTRLFMVPLY